MKQFIHLFKPVSEGLPELDKQTGISYNIPVVISYNNEFDYVSAMHYNSHHEGWFDISGTPLKSSRYSVSHWLDLSRLTTKEAAEQQYQDGYDIGYNAGFDAHQNIDTKNL